MPVSAALSNRGKPNPARLAGNSMTIFTHTLPRRPERMNSRSGKAKLIAIVALFFVMAWPQSGDATSGDLPEKEKRGRQIYLKGESGAGEITAILGSSDLEVPATSLSCA